MVEQHCAPGWLELLCIMDVCQRCQCIRSAEQIFALTVIPFDITMGGITTLEDRTGFAALHRQRRARVEQTLSVTRQGAAFSSRQQSGVFGDGAGHPDFGARTAAMIANTVKVQAVSLTMQASAHGGFHQVTCTNITIVGGCGDRQQPSAILAFPPVCRPQIGLPGVTAVMEVTFCTSR